MRKLSVVIALALGLTASGGANAFPLVSPLFLIIPTVGTMGLGVVDGFICGHCLSGTSNKKADATTPSQVALFEPNATYPELVEMAERNKIALGIQ